MQSKWNFYEYRTATEHDLFANYPDIGLKCPILVRMRDRAKVCLVCHITNPFKSRIKQLAALSCRAKNETLLLTSKEYGF